MQLISPMQLGPWMLSRAARATAWNACVSGSVKPAAKKMADPTPCLSSACAVSAAARAGTEAMARSIPSGSSAIDGTVAKS